MVRRDLLFVALGLALGALLAHPWGYASGWGDRDDLATAQAHRADLREDLERRALAAGYVRPDPAPVSGGKCGGRP